MRSGLLARNRIKVWRWDEQQTPTGEVKRIKVEICTAHAYLYKQSGKHYIAAKELFDEATEVFTTRYTDLIRTNYFIEYKGNNYQITHIEENIYDRTLNITAKLLND